MIRSVFASTLAIAILSASMAAAQSRDPDAHAKELFLQGDRAYAEGRYETALEAFQEAYTLSSRPQLLFNISNAYERIGKLPEAADALQKYLDSGKARDRETVEKRLASLKQRVDLQRKEQERKDKEESERKSRNAETPNGNENGSKSGASQQGSSATVSIGAKPGPSVVPWVLIGGGVVLAGAGSVFGVLALGARSDAQAGCKDSPSGLLCTSDANSALSKDTTFSILADVGIGSGIVLAGVGTVLLLTQDSPKSKAGARSLPQLGVVTRPQGGELRWSGSF